MVRIGFCTVRTGWRHIVLTVVNYEKYQLDPQPSTARKPDSIQPDGVRKPDSRRTQTEQHCCTENEQVRDKNPSEKNLKNPLKREGGEIGSVGDAPSQDSLLSLIKTAKERTGLSGAPAAVADHIRSAVMRIGENKVKSVLLGDAAKGLTIFKFTDLVDRIASTPPKMRDLYGEHLPTDVVVANLNKYRADHTDVIFSWDNRVFSRIGTPLWSLDKERTDEKTKLIAASLKGETKKEAM
jgi:hypothetical protein